MSISGIQQSYCVFKYFQFWLHPPSWIWPEVDFNNSAIWLQHIRTIHSSWVIDDSANIRGPFSEAILYGTFRSHEN